MKRITALILAASMAIALLAGCGTKKAETPPTAPVVAPAKVEPQELTLNIGSELSTLDSAKITDTGSSDMANQIFEGLVHRDANGDLKKGSGAAQDWTISSDGMVYTFTLKDGLKWSDGQPLTAKDFTYAWYRALDPKIGSDYAFILADYIKGGSDWNGLDQKAADFATKYDDLKKKIAIESPDPKTLKITLTHPTPYFLGLMAFSNYYPQRQDIVEKYGDKYAADADKLVYNGPFLLKSWQHDAEMVLEKNPNYWDSKSVKLTKITYKMVADQNTSINMFEAGQLDSVGLSGNNVAQYADKPGFVNTAQAVTWYLQYNLANKDAKFVQNKHIRLALSYAIDRKIFVDTVLKNGSLPASGLIPPSLHINGQAFRKTAGDLIPVTADAKKAQEELAAGLKELGLDKLPPVDFLSNSSDTAKKIAQFVQGMVQQNLPGVTMNIVPVDPKVRLARISAGDFQIAMAGWGGDYDDPNTFLDYWVPGNPQNSGKYASAEYQQMVKDVAAAQDPAKRLDLFTKLEKLIVADAPIVPIYWPASSVVRKPYVKGILNFSVGAATDLKYAYVEGKQ